MARTIHSEEAVVEVLYCAGCDEVREEGEYDTAYQCPECGNQYTREEAGGSHRCADCGKFGAKIGDQCCTDCYEELTTVTAIELQNNDADYVIVDEGGRCARARRSGAASGAS